VNQWQIGRLFHSVSAVSRVVARLKENGGAPAMVGGGAEVFECGKDPGVATHGKIVYISAKFCMNNLASKQAVG